jgi:hypothetical protein
MPHIVVDPAVANQRITHAQKWREKWGNLGGNDANWGVF